MQKRCVGVIGAGPAGIMAALEAARHGARVLLFDRNVVVGRKIHVTGNGRCNISNVGAAPNRYICADREFLNVALERYGHSETIARLDELGIPTYSTPDGWCYPLSNSAASVADALAAQLGLAGVEVWLQHRISDIQQDSGRFTLTAGAPSQTYRVDSVVVAAGGKAYPALGSKGELFPVLEKLGHTIIPIRPALVPVTGEVKHLHKLQGVRLDVGAALLEGDRVLVETVGNLMFTQFGFSGPAAMDVSHCVSTRPGISLTLVIDLVPYRRERLLEMITRFRSTTLPLSVVLGAVMPVKLPAVLIPMAGLPTDVTLSAVSQRKLDRVLHSITHLEVKITGTREFKFAQLSTGGIPVTEVDPQTMESRIVPGLHFAGEVLDVIGPCGGFNLQWAFTSGALAGAGAAARPAVRRAEV